MRRIPWRRIPMGSLGHRIRHSPLHGSDRESRWDHTGSDRSIVSCRSLAWSLSYDWYNYWWWQSVGEHLFTGTDFWSTLFHCSMPWTEHPKIKRFTSDQEKSCLPSFCHRRDDYSNGINKSKRKNDRVLIENHLPHFQHDCNCPWK